LLDRKTIEDWKRMERERERRIKERSLRTSAGLF